ncbi:hypothetical protein Pst134EA_031240 [Puccinia striiformis f. sp. tritici]|uniref:uncharacterized protein n=2 Tax=Puccinia striiformis f. sp. tritici TaxID=168172 RepID=UPI002007E488|nr:uncharacterized protein Pst134EA_031240 [Puccinia striiformis f. sp. tritici]KAH9443446.1 hypothetical protein Pst134EA_031240 [Puccinia striiformis f. sp. tritici]
MEWWGMFFQPGQSCPKLASEFWLPICTSTISKIKNPWVLSRFPLTATVNSPSKVKHQSPDHHLVDEQTPQSSQSPLIPRQQRVSITSHQRAVVDTQRFSSTRQSQIND